MWSFIENMIFVSQHIYSDYLKDVRINHSFYLKPATYDEVAEIIKSLDINKSLGPPIVYLYIFLRYVKISFPHAAFLR